MAHKKKHVHPVPPANRPPAGPPDEQNEAQQRESSNQAAQNEGGFQEQDPQRRIGDFTGTGKQSYKQPGGLNDANH